MTNDTNEQVEPEQSEEEIILEPQAPAAPRRGGGVWAVLTLIFVVVSALLAYLYVEQLGQLQAAEGRADAASSQMALAQQANKGIRKDLNEALERLQDVVKAVERLAEGIIEAPEPEEVKESKSAREEEAKQPKAKAKAAKSEKKAKAPTKVPDRPVRPPSR